MSKTILVIDDSASMRQMVAMTLRGAGYDVVDAVDGKDALSKLDGRKFNLIISDVNMPNMDGISFVKAAKQLPAYKFTPVIMLTTEGSDDKKQQGKAAGVRAWIVKPFQPPMLLDAVSKLVM
ncbi:response regulator [Pseudomonas sp. TTU2014-080ASC]|jgi:two-component system chemotaxis response regulator CheY|uniref:response regulator n=1 Tax=Pseudomonas sp. TTU2014-080ASC TaxID=1729724 RepID=UPI0007186CDE|nr:response regulator [Pseudomonas sp. TTU2014-080ASC]KRW61158.1 chemotaxis protein CheY [Pseudomonas sp. TTU2014-080ASC]